MPVPVARDAQRYLPGLDGLRALAVAAVVLFHVGVGWAPGGLLGVGIFFTLSGYLISDLLLAQWEKGRLRLAEFWLHRARRLLPALVVMLTVVVAWTTLLHRSQVAAMRGTTLASLGFVSNWWFIGHQVPYFDRFGPPSPLGHLWSLAVEEQFYLVWPWLLLGGLLLFPGIRRRLHPQLAGICLLLAIASSVAMGLLHHSGIDNTRVYEGTDTRAFGLLIGAAAAMIWPSRSLTTPINAWRRWVLDGLGLAGLLVIGLLIARTSEYSAWLYHGGMVLLSVATALVVVIAAHPASRLGMGLGVAPLRWLGVRSYGIYLWHLPILVLTGVSVAEQPHIVPSVLRVATIVGAAALSWRYVEEPIRHGALGRLWRQWQLGRRVRVRAWQAAGATAAVGLLVTACVGMSGADTPPTSHQASLSQPTSSTLTSPSAPVPSSSAGADQPGSRTAPSASAPKTTSHAPGTRRPATSCRAVVHIGDSTSEGLVSPDYLPNPAQRIDAQYRRVGATDVEIQISGGTSVLETAFAGEANAAEVARRLIASGFHGCWVLALGTNDTADVEVGSALDRAGRINTMMSIIGGQPVLWLTVKSLRASGSYAESAMRSWNTAITAACPAHSNMRIYDWASVVRNDWFQSDGIHFTTVGYAARARMIANALAQAYPATGAAAAGCVVR